MDDESVEKLYYSIGEVSAMLKCSPSQLRFWEEEFEVLRPKKTKKGNRLYTREDMETIKLIYFLTKEQGHTLQGARDKIGKQRQNSERNMQIMESLKKLRQFLVEMKEGL